MRRVHFEKLGWPKQNLEKLEQQHKWRHVVSRLHVTILFYWGTSDNFRLWLISNDDKRKYVRHAPLPFKLALPDDRPAVDCNIETPPLRVDATAGGNNETKQTRSQSEPQSPAESSGEPASGSAESDGEIN